jgi:hypothetical protein
MDPDPFGDVLARWVLEPVDFVQVPMIELVVDRLECLSDVGEVRHPTLIWIDWATNMYLDTIRVAMQAGALVVCWHTGQTMRSLESELLEDLHQGIPRNL